MGTLVVGIGMAAFVHAEDMEAVDEFTHFRGDSVQGSAVYVSVWIRSCEGFGLAVEMLWCRIQTQIQAGW